MRASPRAGLFLALCLAAGCELIASVDPEKIPGEGAGPTGGSGGAPACDGAEDCPSPESECMAAACTDGICGLAPRTAGEQATQVVGNCAIEQCDGNGSVTSVPDDNDLPNDSNACTDDVCTNGEPSNPPLSAGETCGRNDGLVCDGEGNCVGCVVAGDCGEDDECQTFACTDRRCSSTNAPQGTVIGMQSDGDCHINQCNGSGGIENVEDNEDLPIDNNECTQDLCAAGTPSNPDEPVGTSCGISPEQCDGAGSCVECIGPADCPGVDDECRQRTCTLGVCGFDFTAAGFAIAGQTDGDCQELQCDGAGNTVSVDTNTDVPVDNNACTDDVCDAGAPSNPFEPSGTSCGGTLVCDGAGQCVGCNVPADCPGGDDECKTRTCSGAGVCGFDFTVSGFVVQGQTPGDCRQNQCDGNGNITDVPLNTDVPPSDNNQCTNDVCVNGAPQHPFVPTGTTCSQNGGIVCSAAGTCVACNVADDCAGTDTDCQTRVCNANNTCGTAFEPSGTVTSNQTPNDCQQNQCNGTGGIISVPFNSDVPVDDGNACTTSVCNAGVPGHMNVSNGTSCSDGSLCTQTDTCQAGVCTGSNPVVCTPSDQCHSAGTCNPATGTCSNPNAPDGTACSDGSMCTQTDACQAGTCTGSNPVICAPSDQCHDAGTCNPANGTCDNPAKADGTACNDGSACTQTDTCQAGTCTGSSPVICAPSDQCHVAGTCNPSDGTCTNPTAADGTTCNDGNPCTQTDTCSDGTCGGGNPVVCAPLDECHLAGTCSPGTGLCDNPVAPDGTSCSVGADPGTCDAGTCIIAPAVTGTSPIDGATAVATSTAITVAFNVPMNPATLTVKSTLDSGPCTGSIQVSSDNFATCIALGAPVMSAGDSLATIVPAPGLAFGSSFKIKVTTDAQNALGTALTADVVQPVGFTTKTGPQQFDGSIVISQVYGGGGNSGAPYLSDFIEIHNRGTTSVSLAGWAVQYASATGNSWSVTNLTGTIAPGAYYLVKEGDGAGPAPALPTPDATGSIMMGGQNFKVALTNTTTALTVVCPTGGSIVDLVGVGTATCFEGTAASAAASNTTSASRNLDGHQDTNQNSLDFTVGTVNPRNSSSPPASPTLVVNELGVAGEADFCNVQFPATLSVTTATTAGPVFCQVYEAGETEAPGAAGTFTVEVGYGPIGSNPQNQAGWTWIEAPFNTDPVGQPNNDEYSASFTAPAPGTYRYACRVTRPSGITYCDTNGAGSNPGLAFDTPHQGELTVTP